MSDNPKYIQLTDSNFRAEVLESDKPVLVDFWAAWCGPCRMIAPIIEELAEEYEGRAVIGKLDVDHNQQVSMHYGIRSIPSLLLFKDGQVVDQLIGVVPKKELVKRIEAHTDSVNA